MPDDFVLFTSAVLGFVNLGVARCSEATSGTDTGTANFGFLLARILEPEDERLLGNGVLVYFYRLEHFTLADDVYARVAQAAGVDRIVVDDLDVDVGTALSAGHIRGAGVDYALTMPVSVAGVGAGPVNGPIHWREYHAVEGGYAYLDAFLLGGPGANTMPAVIQATGGAAGQVYQPVEAGLTAFGEQFHIANAHVAVLAFP